MSNIDENLKKIESAVWGKDVRKAIHDSIHDCYEDGKAGTTDLIARERINNLSKMKEGSTTGDAELQDIRIGADGKKYPNAGEAVRGQLSELKEDLVNKVVIQKGKIEETNCDLITKNGIYEIDTNFQNAPNMKENGILVVMTSGAIQTRIVQMVYEYSKLDGTNKKAWIRFAKLNTNPTSWSEWDGFLLNSAFNDAFITSFNDAFTTSFNDIFNDAFTTSFNDAFNDVYKLTILNLFNGNYITGYKLYGDENEQHVSINKNCNSLAIIRVKPNTKYSILIEDKGAESTGYRYFKCAFYNGTYCTPSDIVEKPLTPVFDHTRGDVYVKHETVTTLADTTYLIIMTALTKHPFLQVFEGKISDFTTDSYSNRYTIIDLKKDLSIKYQSDTDYDIYFGKYHMKLFYSDSESADMHNWNIGKIYYGSEIVVPAGTDIIGPIKISGDADFLSGVHGSSTTTMIKVYADGVPVELNSSLAKKFSRLTIFMIDECRSEKTREHVFDRYVTIEITKNKIHICNMFKCVSSSPVTVERATNGGLMAVRNNILTGASMNNYICTEPPVVTINNDSPKNVHAVLNLTMGSITIDNIVGKENSTYKGKFNVFINENPVRTKTYFDIMQNEQVTKGKEIIGEFEYTFT